jgi:hypothetical protein
MGLRGPKAKSAAYHLARGTFRADRHGPRPRPPDAKSAVWELLKLPPTRWDDATREIPPESDPKRR